MELKPAAERQADRVIAGARGASLIHGLLMRSVSERRLTEAPCSVLIVQNERG
jgi:nucleotide-binding universal stress UspA family protein